MSMHDHNHGNHSGHQPPAGNLASAVLEMKGLHWPLRRPSSRPRWGVSPVSTLSTEPRRADSHGLVRHVVDDRS